jgi:hypothetical protein
MGLTILITKSLQSGTDENRNMRANLQAILNRIYYLCGITWKPDATNT